MRKSIEIPNYKTYAEASKAAQALKITKMTDYEVKHRLDPKLPNRPDQHYPNEWVDNGRWSGFLGDSYDAVRQFRRTTPYETIFEARSVAIEAGFKSKQDYTRKSGKIDSKLPASPEHAYQDGLFEELGGWPWFLGIKEKVKKYETYQECKDAVEKLGIKSQQEYSTRYKEDPRLCSNPNTKFKSVWKQNDGWTGYVSSTRSKAYRTYEEASLAAQKLGIMNSQEYRERHKEDPKLPYTPATVYESVFYKNGGFSSFLGVKDSASTMVTVTHDVGCEVKQVTVTRLRLKQFLGCYIPRSISSIDIRSNPES